MIFIPDRPIAFPLDQQRNLLVGKSFVTLWADNFWLVVMHLFKNSVSEENEVIIAQKILEISAIWLLRLCGGRDKNKSLF